MSFLRRAVLGAASFLLLLHGLPASAQSDFETVPAPYVSVAGVYGICNFSPTTGGATGSCSDNLDNSFGLNLRAGFRFNRWIAVEGMIEWMSGFDVKAQNPAPGSPQDLSADALAFTLNAKVYPLEGRIQPYALLGLGGLNTWLNSDQGQSATFTSFVGRMGVGVDVYITTNLALTGEFAYTAATEATATFVQPWPYPPWPGFQVGSGIDPSYMSVIWGLTYRFQ